ncbi:MAG: class I SAM-dependent methyltransferase [Acidimicrobiales bacterium]
MNEPYARAANDLIFDRVEVGAGTRYLDIACGSGLASSTARRRGAEVAGLDASEALIQIARARTPDGDFRVGDMFDLPFVPDSFDVVERGTVEAINEWPDVPTGPCPGRCRTGDPGNRVDRL